MFRVNLERLLEWLERGRRRARDSPGTQQLRGLLDVNMCEPRPEETEPGKVRRRPLAEKPTGSAEAHWEAWASFPNPGTRLVPQLRWRSRHSYHVFVKFK
jgi:hypothetical protein